MSGSEQYDLKSVKLPRLAGRQLSMIADALESGLLRSVIMPSMLKTGGIQAFRSLAPEEPPTVFPIAFVEKPAKPVDGPDLDMLNKIEGGGTGIPYRTARGYAQVYREGKATPEDVAKSALEAIKKSDSGELKLRPFIAVNEEDVIEAGPGLGRALEGRQASERAGWRARSSKGRGGHAAISQRLVGTCFIGKERQPDRTARRWPGCALQARLLLGKANMHEIGINPDGLNVNYGSTRNPFNPKHDTGGSSSGSADCRSSGHLPVAVGADGGGSIRIPAALCGVVGLKPTFGRVSEFGAFPLCWSVAHLGPMAATRRGCGHRLCLLWRVRTSRNPTHCTSLP